MAQLILEMCERMIHDNNIELFYVNLILPGRGTGGGDQLFLHNPETPQAIKLKHSDFKDTSFRHILQVISVSYILSCYYGNKITRCTSQNLAP